MLAMFGMPGQSRTAASEQVKGLAEGSTGRLKWRASSACGALSASGAVPGTRPEPQRERAII